MAGGLPGAAATAAAAAGGGGSAGYAACLLHQREIFPADCNWMALPIVDFLNPKLAIC